MALFSKKSRTSIEIKKKKMLHFLSQKSILNKTQNTARRSLELGGCSNVLGEEDLQKEIRMNVGDCYVFDATRGTLFTFGDSLELIGYNQGSEVARISNGLGGTSLELLIRATKDCFVYFWYSDSFVSDEYRYKSFSQFFDVYAIFKQNWEGNVVVKYDVHTKGYQESDTNYDHVSGTIYLEQINFFHPFEINVTVSPSIRTNIETAESMSTIISPKVKTFESSFISLFSDLYSTDTYPAQGEFIRESLTEVSANSIYPLPSYIPDKVIKLRHETLYSYNEEDYSDFYKHRKFDNVSSSLVTTIIIAVIVVAVVLAAVFSIIWFVVCKKGLFTNDKATCYKEI